MRKAKNKIRIYIVYDVHGIIRNQYGIFFIICTPNMHQ